MTTDPMPYIIAAAFIGVALGFLIGCFLAGCKMQRIERRSWNQARIFYAKLHAEGREDRL